MDERPAHRERAAIRWITTAWCLVAGAFLAIAPLAWWPTGAPQGEGLHAVMAIPLVKAAVSAFGALLLGCGAWDVSRFVVEEAG